MVEQLEFASTTDGGRPHSGLEYQFNPGDNLIFAQNITPRFDLDNALTNALSSRNTFNASDRDALKLAIEPTVNGDPLLGLTNLINVGPIDGLQDRFRMFKDVMKDLGVDANILEVNGRFKINLSQVGQNSGLSLDFDPRTGRITMQEFERGASGERVREMFNNRTEGILRGNTINITRGPHMYPAGITMGRTILDNLKLNYSGIPT